MTKRVNHVYRRKHHIGRCELSTERNQVVSSQQHGQARYPDIDHRLQWIVCEASLYCSVQPCDYILNSSKEDCSLFQ